MEDYNIFNMFDYGDPSGGVADPTLGTNVNYATAGGSGVENFAQGQNPNLFLSAGSNYADTGGVKAAVPGTDLYNQLQSDARTRGQQAIAKIAALVGGGAFLANTAWGSALPGQGSGGLLTGSGTASVTDSALGSVLPTSGGFGGVAGSGAASIGTEAAGYAAGGAGAAGASGGALAGLGSGSVPAATSNLGAWGGSTLMPGSALPPAASSGGGLLSSLLGGGGGSTATSGQSWWQQLLGGLGSNGSLGSNIFAGLQGAGLLGSLTGGNGLSDALGLTGDAAAKYGGPNISGPGGSGSSYNPDTNTLTGTRGNLDPVQSQFATYAGNQLGQADQTTQTNDILKLLREQAAPQEQRQLNSVNNNLFSRGQLGGASSATGEAYRGLGEAQNSADLQRQLAAYSYGQQGANDAYDRASGAAGVAGNLQGFNSALSPQDPGQTSPLMNLLNQMLTGAKP